MPASSCASPPPVPAITPADRTVLRRLADRVATLAHRDIELEKRRLWTAHNDLTGAGRPLIFCDPEHGWNEIITPDQLQCTGELARQWELPLRKSIFWGESMGDDRVIEPCFDLPHVHAGIHWGASAEYEQHDAHGSYRWTAPITDLHDLSALHFPEIKVDHAATQRLHALANETLGDLLPIRLRNPWYWSLGLTREFIKLRGLEAFMLDMCTDPEGIHHLMAFLRDGMLQMIDTLEREGLYTLNNQGDYVGSGGFGWTSQLPAPDFSGSVRPRDLWCLLESQETVGCSPHMFEEFIFPYQLPIAERFGRICYGCCEPVHARWHVLRRLTNLRRVSVSPWCDRALMAEYLGQDYVYSLKPHPGLLAADRLDEDALRADIRDALAKARGCHLEIIMKDNHTIKGEPERVIRWCRVAREEIDHAG